MSPRARAISGEHGENKSGEHRASGPLREGFTTGTAATAAAMAALEYLLGGTVSGSITVPLPPFAEGGTESGPQNAEGANGGTAEKPAGTLAVPVLEVQPDPAHARAALACVIKDGGDDPDATHGARIMAHVVLEVLEAPEPRTAHENNTSLLSVHILGGKGVGRATLPGLPVPVGAPAINPVPRQQIAHGLRTVAARHGYIGALRVTISVPQGEELARHTFNPRLGIVGGISILGTQGTVKPYSHEAWRATIRQGLDVAEATGCTTLCLSTGRRSEKLLLGLYPHLPAQAAVQVADFAEFSLREAGRRPFTELVWGCFFGKLVKLAQGHSYTHARSAELDFALLGRWCAENGARPESAEAVTRCVTANHALEILLEREGEERATAVVRAIALKAAAVARGFVHQPQRVLRVHVFHLNGKELVRV